MMRWMDALAGVETLEQSATDVTVSGVEYDSRRVRAGDIFVAMRGEVTDGNWYIDAAVAKGAPAVVTDYAEAYAELRASRSEIATALVEHGRRALAGVSANVFGRPAEKLKLSAVTGTNGKTTTAFLLEQMLRSAGRECVLVGTIEMHVAGEVRMSPHTTPESRDLLEVFAEGVERGATEAVFEASSHALQQERVWGLPVDVAMFTNLTQDHLDYHGSMMAYAAAKARLFAGVGAAAPRVAVINADDAYGNLMARAAPGCAVLRYGLEQGDWRAEEMVLGAGETRFKMKTPVGDAEMRSKLTGRVNVYNLLAASAAAWARGLSLEEIVVGAERLAQVPGRFQVVPSVSGVTVVVDYAHTDDALRNLIALARELAGRGRVITMFGCGGDRDRTKRPKMGRVAGVGSDLVVVTSDNPRSEDPMSIIDEVLTGAMGMQAMVEVEIGPACSD